MEMWPGHLASSGNLLCRLSRTAGANQQTLIFFSVGWPLAETMGRPGLLAFLFFGEEIESTA